jgi:tRNA threonylcarbamoyladenosine biosynthesis protein TsaE
VSEADGGLDGRGAVVMTERELQDWGEALGRAAAAAEVFVALYGELGAGKSTLVRAACRALGVTGSVPSPTFTLVNIHRGTETEIHHADLYRLEPPVAEKTLVDAGWPELLEAEGPVFVEWADRAADWLPPDRWDIELARAPGDPMVRLAEIRARGMAPEPPPPALHAVDESRRGGR